MKFNIPDGVWPTMITPFTEDNRIDYGALADIVEWYIGKGVDGLFAVCQSSEMFFLTLRERVELARSVKQYVRGRIPVIASGHISDTGSEQIEELKAMVDTGMDAIVLISSRLAMRDEPDCVLKRNVEIIIKAVPDIPMGIYECPYPYKRVLSPGIVEWCAGLGRFLFLKDTSRDPRLIKEKIDVAAPAGLKVFNANAATLLQTLDEGAAGYSGVMANFHPDLFHWLIINRSKDRKMAEELQTFLGFASSIEYQYYPINAKYYLQLEGIKIRLDSRSSDHASFDLSHRLETEYLRTLSKEYSKKYSLEN